MDSIFPSQLKAGLTFDQLVTVLTQYPAPAWELRAYLRGPSQIDLVAEAEGTKHRWHETATDSATWAPGHYTYTVRVFDGSGDAFEVDSGSTQIAPDLASIDAPYDGRSHARKVLDAIEAVLEKRATKDQERYTIEFNGSRRELWRTPIADLMAMRGSYQAQVRAEETKAKGGSLFGVAVRVRF